MPTARRFIVHGRVQGVGFRYFAQRAAATRGVNGSARNMPDGTVEVVAEGAPESVDAFRADLARGPRSGHVDRVAEEEIPAANLTDFRILH